MDPSPIQRQCKAGSKRNLQRQEYMELCSKNKKPFGISGFNCLDRLGLSEIKRILDFIPLSFDANP